MFSGFKKDWNLWDNSKTESFLYINKIAVPYKKWLSYVPVKENEIFKNSILKPINHYAATLYPPPKLISITDNGFRLRQGNHAEMFLLVDHYRRDGQFYNIDRPWIRQYYSSAKEYILPDGCFDGIYRFYVPWIIDENVTVNFKQADDSPFYIYEDSIAFTKIPFNTSEIEPPFIHFHFKNVGKHMLDSEFGKIKKQSPMFDIEVQTTDIMLIERVREFYEFTKDKILSV
jgi:hypothetical protein